MKKTMFFSLVTLVLLISACGNKQGGKPGEAGTVNPADVDDPNRIVKNLKCDLNFVKSFSEGGNLYTADSNLYVLFHAGMAIDADGCPRAYHPISDQGLDNLYNAGYSGNWWGIVTDNGNTWGNPVVQRSGDPAPGFYVSQTSLQDTNFAISNPRRYVDADKIPYVVLPPVAKEKTKVKIGDIAAVYYAPTEKLCYAIFADVGPDYKIGEGSMALARALGIPDSPKTGGIANGVSYVVFAGTGNQRPRTIEEINTIGEKSFRQFGGLDRLLYCLYSSDDIHYSDEADGEGGE